LLELIVILQEITSRKVREFNKRARGMKRIFDRKKFFSWINAWDIYFIVITLLYVIWRARVFFDRFVSH